MFYISIYKGNHFIMCKDITSLKAISIGRHHLNDIALQDPAISRFHVALFRDNESKYFIQDLGSRNKTYVNTKKMDYGILKDGDTIGVGDYALIFEKKTDKPRQKDSSSVHISKDIDDDTKTVIFPISAQHGKIAQLEADAEKLLLLYKLNRFANTDLDIEESLQLMVEEISNAFHPDRILIAFFEQEGAELRCLAKFPEQWQEIKLSQTLIRYVLDTKQAVISHDALEDERFKKEDSISESIMELQIRSALCVPLIWDGEIRGIIYMDSSKEKGLFSKKHLDLFSLVSQDISSMIEKALNDRAIKEEKLHLENLFDMGNTIIGISPAIKKVIKTIKKLAETDASVLITGETGTGKDLAAKALYYDSKRRGKPFIRVNCAGIPDNLLESEFFGVIANYPGFHNKESLKGKFELANGGTVFLNEIGELPQRLQAKLLDVLEEKEFYPLGADRPIRVDIRIISATNRNLENEINEGHFRQDLFERLNTFPLHMPPLRDRKEDIPILAGYFLYCLRQEYGKRISRFTHASIKTLSDYEWAGNIRELKHVIERAIIQTDRSLISDDLFDLKKGKVKEKLRSLAEIEKEHIKKVLEHTKGNKEKAVGILGISKQTLYNKGKAYRLPGFNNES